MSYWHCQTVKVRSCSSDGKHAVGFFDFPNLLSPFISVNKKIDANPKLTFFVEDSIKSALGVIL